MENVVWGEENRILRIESMNKWWTVYMYAIYACTSMSHHIQPKTFTHKRTSYLKWTWNNICLAHAASCKPTKKKRQIKLSTRNVKNAGEPWLERIIPMWFMPSLTHSRFYAIDRTFRCVRYTLLSFCSTN